MWLTYAEFLSVCAGGFLGSLLGIGIFGAVLYYLVKALAFLLPFILVGLVAALIFCVARHGIRQFFIGLGTLTGIFLLTLLVSGVFLCLSAVLANYNHMVWAIILFIPGILVAGYGFFYALIAFIIVIQSNDADKDRGFAFWMVVGFALNLGLVHLNIRGIIPEYIGWVNPTVVILLVYIVLVNLIRRHDMAKSVLMGTIPVIGSICLIVFQSMQLNLWVNEIRIVVDSVGINTVLFVGPAMITGLINRKR